MAVDYQFIFSCSYQHTFTGPRYHLKINGKTIDVGLSNGTSFDEAREVIQEYLAKSYNIHVPLDEIVFSWGVLEVL